MKALILVDLQIDLMPGGAVAVPNGDAIIPVINQLQGCFKLVVATQDWHPANHRFFSANHPGQRPGDVVMFRKANRVLNPVHCVQNTRGAELAPALMLNRLNKVFKKGADPDLDSYSAFFDSDHQHTTGLGSYLQEKRIKQLYICGLPTEYGVKHTALDGLGFGFPVYLIEDACRGMNQQPEDAQNAVEEMKAAGVKIIQSIDLLRPNRPAPDNK
jgi:nicotinamidase/pyrazinamidase